jgi:cytochrome c peroxidase
MNKLFALTILVILTLCAGLIGCKDDEQGQVAASSAPTAYEFTYLSTLGLRPQIPADNQLTNEGVKLGRMLFYDPILSADSTVSCASCHNQKHGFTDNGKKFSTGINGHIGKRNTMPIFNLMWHLDGFFWDQRSDILRHQALEPIVDETEMGETLGSIVAKLEASSVYPSYFEKAFGSSDIDEELVGKALEQFMLSIVSLRSKFDRVEAGIDSFTVLEKTGAIVFNGNIDGTNEAIPIHKEIDPNNPKNYLADCGHCHSQSLSLFRVKEAHTNGLPSNGDLGKGEITQNPNDNFRFKTPTLRNIAVTAPYMHDGRFQTLEEVVQFYLSDMNANSPVSLSDAPSMHILKDSVYLNEYHKKALIAFLHTLTDEEFMEDRRYSSPFE